MSRKLFSIRSPMSLKGREFRGLRGFAGKPLHPALAHFPVAAYPLAAAFDLISRVVGDGSLARDAYVAATWVLTAGAVLSLPTALTGLVEWLRSAPKHTQAWRVANWHMAVMVVTTVIVAVDVVMRLTDYDAATTPLTVLVLSLVAAATVMFGAMFGGDLAYDYGFSVEMRDGVWEDRDEDVYPDGTVR